MKDRYYGIQIGASCFFANTSNFHVSCLNKVIGENLPVQTILPELDEEGKIILEPEAVMETRTRQLENRSISEYLIKWKNLPTEDSTWEDDNFIQKHPELLKH